MPTYCFDFRRGAKNVEPGNLVPAGNGEKNGNSRESKMEKGKGKNVEKMKRKKGKEKEKGKKNEDRLKIVMLSRRA